MAEVVTVVFGELEVRAGTDRQLHGLACRWFEEAVGRANPRHRDQVKPWAVWPVLLTPAGAELRAVWLADEPPPAAWGPGDGQVRLGSTVARCRVERMHVDPAALRAGRGASIAACRFVSPTWFTNNGSDLPLPLPTAIVRSLATSWSAATEVPLHPDADVLAEVDRSVVVVAHDVRTYRTDEFAACRVLSVDPLRVEPALCRPARRDPRARAGFTGTVRLRLRGVPSEGARLVFAALMRWANLAGVGARRTHGAGAVLTTLLDDGRH